MILPEKTRFPRIIALDLDGTLLNSKKELTHRSRKALEAAASYGAEIVPTTGRFYLGMPECIRDLPFLHYAITINGAQVYDVRNDRALAKAEIPVALAVGIMTYLDTLPVIYDCYMDNWGWMTKEMQDRCEDFVENPVYIKMIREIRKGVPELKAYISETGHGIQKIQLFTKDQKVRHMVLDTLADRFPGIIATSAISNNVEINDVHANKGEALMSLASFLGVPRGETCAFGDGLNDLNMLKDAGLGVAMANSCPEVLEAADAVTLSCDEDGVAAAIEEMIRRFSLQPGSSALY